MKAYFSEGNGCYLIETFPGDRFTITPLYERNLDPEVEYLIEWQGEGFAAVLHANKPGKIWEGRMFGNCICYEYPEFDIIMRLARKHKDAAQSQIGRIDIGACCSACGGQCCCSSVLRDDGFITDLTPVEYILLKDNAKLCFAEDIGRDNSAFRLMDGRSAFLVARDGRCAYAGPEGCTAPVKPFGCAQFFCDGRPEKVRARVPKDILSEAMDKWNRGVEAVQRDQRCYSQCSEINTSRIVLAKYRNMLRGASTWEFKEQVDRYRRALNLPVEAQPRGSAKRVPRSNRFAQDNKID